MCSLVALCRLSIRDLLSQEPFKLATAPPRHHQASNPPSLALGMTDDLHRRWGVLQLPPCATTSICHLSSMSTSAPLAGIQAAWLSRAIAAPARLARGGPAAPASCRPRPGPAASRPSKSRSTLGASLPAASSSLRARHRLTVRPGRPVRLCMLSAWIRLLAEKRCEVICGEESEHGRSLVARQHGCVCHSKAIRLLHMLQSLMQEARRMTASMRCM